MVFTSFCVLAGLLLVSPVSPARLSVTIGSSLTLPCSGDPSRDVEWYFQQKDHTVRRLVAKFHNGAFIPGTDFENRVKSFHLEKEGNYSLTLSPVYSDHGIYKCQYDDKNILSDVKLDIIVPSVISIPMGMSASLLCFGNIDKQARAVDLDIHWKRNGLTVYQLYKNNITYGPGFENRVSLSTEHALQGNMSLTIRQTLFSDQGDYQCSYNSPKERGNPDSASLTVTDPPLSGGVIAGIVVGVLLLVAAVAGIGFAVRKYLQNRAKRDDGISYQAACTEDQNGYNIKTEGLLVPGSPEPHLSVSETQPAPPESPPLVSETDPSPTELNLPVTETDPSPTELNLPVTETDPSSTEPNLPVTETGSSHLIEMQEKTPEGVVRI